LISLQRSGHRHAIRHSNKHDLWGNPSGPRGLFRRSTICRRFLKSTNNEDTIYIKFYIKPLHKTLIVPSVMQHFINLISPFTLHVSAFIGHLQVFYFFWLILLLVLPFIILLTFI
jgi:hypothetical protein